MAKSSGFNVNTLLELALVAGAIYIAYKIFNVGASAATAVQQGFSSASSSVADVLEQLFPYSNVQAQSGQIALPNGTVIAATAAQGQGSYTASDGTARIQFLYGGAPYNIPATPDANGNYTARAGVGG